MNFPKVKVKRHWLETLKAARKVLYRTDTVASAVMLAAVKTRDSMTAEEIVKALLDSVRPSGSFTFWMGASLAPEEDRQKLREDWLDHMIEECEALLEEDTINAKLAELKSQRSKLDFEIGILEAGLRQAGLKDLMAAGLQKEAKPVVEVTPDKWKVGDVVKCMCANTDFTLGRLYKIANISKDHIMLQTSPKKYKWTSVNKFKLIGGNHGTHSR